MAQALKQTSAADATMLGTGVPGFSSHSSTNTTAQFLTASNSSSSSNTNDRIGFPIDFPTLLSGLGITGAAVSEVKVHLYPDNYSFSDVGSVLYFRWYNAPPSGDPMDGTDYARAETATVIDSHTFDDIADSIWRNSLTDTDPYSGGIVVPLASIDFTKVNTFYADIQGTFDLPGDYIAFRSYEYVPLIGDIYFGVSNAYAPYVTITYTAGTSSAPQLLLMKIG